VTPPLGVIFDMDGVILDSVSMNLATVVDTYAEFDVIIPPDDLFGHRGLSLRDLHKHWMAQLNKSVSYADYEQRYNTVIEARRAELLQRGAEPALVQFIRSIEAVGIPLAIASMNLRRNCETVLDAFGILDAFSAIIDCEDTPAHKPKPDVFLLAAQAINREPQHCVVIEDAENGIEAAHNAGMIAIGFTGYLRSTNEPLLPHADVRINSFAELSFERLSALIEYHIKSH